MLKSVFSFVVFWGILLLCVESVPSPSIKGRDSKDLYVDAAKGKDTNDGLSESSPLKTVQAAASKAVNGSTVYIADGIYHETLTIPSGSEEGYIRYVGTGNNVIFSGSVSASAFKCLADCTTKNAAAFIEHICNCCVEFK